MYAFPRNNEPIEGVLVLLHGDAHVLLECLRASKDVYGSSLRTAMIEQLERIIAARYGKSGRSLSGIDRDLEQFP